MNEEHFLKVHTIRINKAYFLKDFDEFKKKHHYLCVSGTSSQKELVKAEARYPSEVKQGLLYMGNMMHVLDKQDQQMRLLGIKTIVYLSPNKFDHLEANELFKCYHYEVKEQDKPDLDIDVIAELIISEMKTPERSPVFVFDVSGMLSAAICCKVMLESNKAWSKEIATMFIINKRYEAKDMPSWLYQQINLHGVKKKRTGPIIIGRPIEEEDREEESDEEEK